MGNFALPLLPPRFQLCSTCHAFIVVSVATSLSYCIRTATRHTCPDPDLSLRARPLTSASLSPPVGVQRSKRCNPALYSFLCDLEDWLVFPICPIRATCPEVAFKLWHCRSARLAPSHRTFQRKHDMDGQASQRLMRAKALRRELVPFASFQAPTLVSSSSN